MRGALFFSMLAVALASEVYPAECSVDSTGEASCSDVSAFMHSKASVLRTLSSSASAAQDHGSKSDVDVGLVEMHAEVNDGGDETAIAREDVAGWHRRRRSATPTPPPKAAQLCTWGPVITGSIAGRNIKGYTNVKNIDECKSLCEDEPSCVSVDFEWLGSSRRCFLGNCRIGMLFPPQPNECWNDNDATYHYSSCYPPLRRHTCSWGPHTTGSIAGHNLECSMRRTLEQCQTLCEANAACKSIDYKPSDGHCCLGNCRVGDPGCSNDGHSSWWYYACN